MVDEERGRVCGIHQSCGAAYLSVRTPCMAHTAVTVLTNPRADVWPGIPPVRIMKGEREDYNSDRQSELPMVGYDVREGSSEGNKHATCNPCQ